MEQHAAHVVVEDIERALSEVSGIKAARVVVSPEGTILEVHVLALPNKSPKQIVRDVESTVMARFGIPVDHRKVSIAQLGVEAMPKEDEPAESSRARIHAVDESVSGVLASARVTIELEEELWVGEASGPASETGRRRIIAEAALEAIQQYAHGALTFGLEDISVVQLGRERVAVACVTLVTPMGEQAFSGSALVRQNEKDSIVRATLDAINRRLHLLTST